MSSVTKDFIMRVAVGIHGHAVMGITETLNNYSFVNPDEINADCISQEIKEIGIEEWVDYYLQDVPKEPGIYTFRGTVRFDEDSSDYSMTCDQV